LFVLVSGSQVMKDQVIKQKNGYKSTIEA